MLGEIRYTEHFVTLSFLEKWLSHSRNCPSNFRVVTHNYVSKLSNLGQVPLSRTHFQCYSARKSVLSRNLVLAQGFLKESHSGTGLSHRISSWQCVITQNLILESRLSHRICWQKKWIAVSNYCNVLYVRETTRFIALVLVCMLFNPDVCMQEPLPKSGASIGHVTWGSQSCFTITPCVSIATL